MAVEYKDFFGDIKPFDDAMNEFTEALKDENSLVKALHVGTEQELIERKKKVDIEKKLSELDEELQKLKANSITSEHVEIPNKDEVKKYGNK